MPGKKENRIITSHKFGFGFLLGISLLGTWICKININSGFIWKIKGFQCVYILKNVPLHTLHLVPLYSRKYEQNFALTFGVQQIAIQIKRGYL